MRCVRTTPFGSPVVPLVKSTTASSSSRTSGTSRSDEPHASSSSHDTAPSSGESSTTSSCSSLAAATLCAVAAKRAAQNITSQAASSTCRTISRGSSRVLSGIGTAPTRWQAYQMSAHSTELCHNTATRIPLSTPFARNAWASHVACSSSSFQVSDPFALAIASRSG